MLDYANLILKESKNVETKVDFRWKKTYSKIEKIVYGLRFYNDSKIVYKESFPKSPYIAAFFKGYSFRENCYNCKYASTKRIGDITLGDFWGLGTQVATKLCLNNGVSMVMINTEKGRSLFELCKQDCETENHSLTDATSSNSNLRHPTRRPADKDGFNSMVKQEGLKSAVLTYLTESVSYTNPDAADE